MMQINIVKDLVKESNQKLASLSVDVKGMEERLDFFAKAMHELKEQLKKKK